LSAGKKILILAGETSGDAHAANLVQEWKKRNPNDQFWGTAGEKMVSAGVESLCSVDKMAVVGFSETIQKLPFMFRLAKTIKQWTIQNKPDVLILVDFPGFNLRMAKRLQQFVPKIWYFITPQVWAWGSGRVAIMQKYIDHLFVLFAFEKEFFDRENIPCMWMGHPLLDDFDEQDFFRDSTKKNLVFFPGSRTSEIKRHLPVMIESANLIAAQFDDWNIQFSKAKCLEDSLFQDVPYEVIDTSSAARLQSVDFAVTASGTNTLELALAEVPMIVIYKLAPLTYFLAKRFVTIPHISLVNIVADKSLVPELIQKDASPQNIANKISIFFQQPQQVEEQKINLKTIAEKLGEPGAIARAVDKMFALLR